MVGHISIRKPPVKSGSSFSLTKDGSASSSIRRKMHPVPQEKDFINIYCMQRRLESKYFEAPFYAFYFGSHTSLMERSILPCLSSPINLTFTSSPTFTTSSTFSTRWFASFEMWTSPSLPGRNSTNAPN